MSPMRVALVGLVFVLASCAADDENLVDAPASDGAATNPDASGVDAAALDGPAAGDGVVCARLDQSCTGATPECCDVRNGTDTCIAPADACAGDRLACDGPEDCPVSEECCLFAGQGSRCLEAGICGTTGSISNAMCHVIADCDQGEMCCGTAPGPAVDLYGICSDGPCPQ